MADFSSSCRQLHAFLEKLSYSDFSTIPYPLVEDLLQEAGVTCKQEEHMLDVPPYATPVMDLRFKLVLGKAFDLSKINYAY
jgi:hypothetical protein